MRILVAEDDEMLRAFLVDFLTGLDHEVKSVANGAELIKLAMAERPDLVITDLNMPEMAGDSMIAMIDMYPGLAGLPIIIISGASDEAKENMGIPEGIPILDKPFDFDKLKAELAKVAAKLPQSPK